MLALAFLTSCASTGHSQTERLESFGDVSAISRPDQSRWQQLNTPFSLSPADINTRVDYNSSPVMNRDAGINIAGWRGENVYAQVVVSAKRDISSLQVTATDLINGSGGRIESRNANIGYVYYVLANNSKGLCHVQPGQTFTDIVVPDIIDFESNASFVKANTNRPVWVRIKIPMDAAPGNYTGKITASAGNQTESVNITVNVTHNVMPTAANKKFFLELWQYPVAEADYYHVKPWSEQHFTLMKPAMVKLKNAGEDVITAPFFWDPFNPRARDADEMTVKVIKKKDGGWDYDFTNFDKWISYMMDIGITKQITCFGMAPLNYRFYYLDEATNTVTYFQQGVNGPQYKAYWTSLLNAFEKHLKDKGWFDRTTLGFSEKNPDVLIPLIKFIKGLDPQWKISFSGKYYPQVQDDIYDYSLISNQQIPPATIAERRSKGYITTFYTSCWEKFPNTFVMSDPVDATWLSLNAANRGMDGYLRYAYDFWTPKVMTDERAGIASGDRYLIYPNGYSSIRFEMLRDGIEDFEKIHSKLGGNIGPNNAAVSGGKAQQIRAALSQFDFKKVSANASRAQQIQEVRKLLE